MKSKDVNFRPDVIIYATGYKQDFSWLKSCGIDVEKEGGLDGYCNVRGVCRRGKEKEMAWIGFLRPGVGGLSFSDRDHQIERDNMILVAIPPMAEQQAMFWTLLLQDRIPVPTGEGNYHLLTSKKARIQCACFFLDRVSKRGDKTSSM
jgi:dimethylaniline monooxygenase (N-oxide forming)